MRERLANRRAQRKQKAGEKKDKLHVVVEAAETAIVRIKLTENLFYATLAYVKRLFCPVAGTGTRTQQSLC